MSDPRKIVKSRRRVAGPSPFADLAAEIARELFTDWQGEAARRLVMEQRRDLDGGGWSQPCMADFIEQLLLRKKFSPAAMAAERVKRLKLALRGIGTPDLPQTRQGGALHRVCTASGKGVKGA